MADVLRRWWVQVLLVFIASRIVSTTIMLVYAMNQVANPWTDASPDYVSYASMWDSLWYLRVVMDGYPTLLPLDDAGAVAENAWAFMPAYPYLVGTLSWLAAVPFRIVAIGVSLVCAGAASFVFYRLFATWLPQGASVAAVALMLFSPISPILQVGYAESMQLLLLGISLLLLVRRRYVAMLPWVVLMSFTRPTGLAFALAMAGHVALRWWRHRRHGEPYPRAEVLGSVAVGLASAVAGLAWTWIAAIATGRPDAYMATELAWRQSYIGDAPFLPFLPWLQGAVWWASWTGLPGWFGVLVLLLALALIAAALCSPWMRRLGVDLRIWVAAWMVYLLAVFFPQSSTWRLLLPATPALAALAVPRSRWIVPVAIALGIVGQWFWFGAAWAWQEGDWSPP
ncbi:MAG: hypothetical protein BGO95_08110 [Micrococcales bacterium 73-13]|nr:MAG: hypothetical protein BGO95_08110 [Micrococcales bacterium 73-13]